MSDGSIELIVEGVDLGADVERVGSTAVGFDAARRASVAAGNIEDDVSVGTVLDARDGDVDPLIEWHVTRRDVRVVGGDRVTFPEGLELRTDDTYSDEVVRSHRLAGSSHLDDGARSVVALEVDPRLDGPSFAEERGIEDCEGVGECEAAVGATLLIEEARVVLDALVVGEILPRTTAHARGIGSTGS